jgi:(2Fe-2S) ferredoxin
MSSGMTFRQTERVPQEQARVKALHSINPTLPTNLYPERVWYTSYGSNMHLDRLAAYIQGGRPPVRQGSIQGAETRRCLRGRSLLN